MVVLKNLNDLFYFSLTDTYSIVTFFLLSILQFSQMAWLGFFIYNCPNSYAVTGNQTHISRVAPNSRDLLKDALPIELHDRGHLYCYLKHSQFEKMRAFRGVTTSSMICKDLNPWKLISNKWNFSLKMIQTYSSDSKFNWGGRGCIFIVSGPHCELRRSLCNSRLVSDR